MHAGDHIYVDRLGGVYSHHGIFCGDGEVIHFNGSNWLQSSVHRTSLECFARGDTVQVREYGDFHDEVASLDRDGVAVTTRRLNILMDRLRGLDLSDLDFSGAAVIERAERRLGEAGFHLGFNNCEHFASWCKTGISASFQIASIWRLELMPVLHQLAKCSQLLKLR